MQNHKTNKPVALKVENYKWRGKDKNSKKVFGKIAASSKADAEQLLIEQGIKNLKITKSINLNFFGTNRITTKHINLFTKELSILVKSNMPFINSLDLLILSQKNSSFRQVLVKIRDHIASGLGLAESFGKYKIYFNNFYCGILEAGVASGNLAQMLDELIDYQEKIALINAQVKKALMYPIFVLLFGFAIAIFLLVKVIPQFEAMFNNFGSQLPWITAKVLQTSNFVQNYYLAAVLFSGIIFVVSYFFYRRSLKIKYRLALLLFKLPFIARILRNILAARFSRILALSLSCDIKIVRGLEIAQTAIANPVFSKKIHEVAKKVSLGQKLSFAMESENIFPKLMLQLVSIGEETGNLPTLLKQASEFFNRESEDSLTKLTSMLEPLVIIILGTIIGLLVIAIYLPIFTLNTAIGG